ncbi:MAG: hypothetical protein AAGA80_18965 [Cyanobacteria bacterium P01_F01_bin.143]
MNFIKKGMGIFSKLVDSLKGNPTGVCFVNSVVMIICADGEADDSEFQKLQDIVESDKATAASMMAATESENVVSLIQAVKIRSQELVGSQASQNYDLLKLRLLAEIKDKQKGMKPVDKQVLVAILEKLIMADNKVDPQEQETLREIKIALEVS